VRLISTSCLQGKVLYAALSHRWGKDKDFVLTSALLRSYETEIRPSQVSKTSWDAFHTTRSIGLQYLWIDCLYIIQDDNDDWQRESATMSKVYGLATCTIAAALGGDGDDGCFTTRNQFKYRPCKVPNPFDHDSSLSFYLRSQYFGEIYRREVKGSPWYSRGWVFQERTLSPRLLVFGETQMLWACQKLHAAETWPCEKTSDNYIDRFESFEVDKSRLQALLNRDRSISVWDTAWFAFIQEFTSAELTRISDRLVALQGLADQIALVTERQYCAGLWIDQTLPLSLLWSISPLKSPRSQEYRAPTWSWGSVDGLIEFKKNEVTTRSFPPPPSITIEVHGIAELPEHQRHLSRVPLANLKLSGKLSPVKLVSESRNGPLKLRRRASTILLKSESAARKRFERVKRALNAIWRSSIVRTVLWAMAVPFLCVGFIPYQFALCIWSCVWN
jgi:Heterokaryon incompatibility protein (HET)